MTYSPEDFESIEEVRETLEVFQDRLALATSQQLNPETLNYLTAQRDNIREILKFWEDSAEAAQRVTREHYR